MLDMSVWKATLSVMRLAEDQVHVWCTLVDRPNLAPRRLRGCLRLVAHWVDHEGKSFGEIYPAGMGRVLRRAGRLGLRSLSARPACPMPTTSARASR